jgi:hypothetical protein
MLEKYLEERFIEPLDVVVRFLETKFDSYENMMKKIPDIASKS